MENLALYGTSSLLPDFLDDVSPDNIFSMLENLDTLEDFCSENPEMEEAGKAKLIDGLEGQKCKRRKMVGVYTDSFGERKKSNTHVTVERNRRKQMNENLSVLRSLMPCFYVKRGDQASIIGGVVDYIKELQQLLCSLEARKQRKSYNEILSPRLIPSPRVPPSPLSLKIALPALGVNLPISPRTPTSPYKPKSPLMTPQGYHVSPNIHELSPSNSSSSTTHLTINSANELVANLKSPTVDVEVKFCGANVLLKTISRKTHGQIVKIISTIEELSLEILNVNIEVTDETMVNSFTIKIGIECRLSSEELAHKIQQTFC